MMPAFRTQFPRFLCWFAVGALLSAGPLAAEEREVAKATALSTLRTPPVSALNSITDTELLDHVTYLADDAREGRAAGQPGGRAAGDYLVKQLQTMGLKPGGPNDQYVQEFRDGMRNILAILPGSDPKLAKETIVIGAHYDHVGFGRRNPAPDAEVYNGANDNASGVAGVLEIAEAMAQLPDAPRRSILFALWDGEEKGLLGSKHFVQNPTIEIDGVVMAIALDMIGRIDDDHFIIWGTGTAFGLRELLARHNRQPDLDLEFRVFNLTLSDHQPFFAKDIPAILPSSGIFRELHRTTDDVELINPDGMRRASQLICGLVFELANRDDKLEFAEVSKSEAARNPWRRADPPTPRSDDTEFRLGFTCQREAREPNAVITVSVTTGTPAALAGLEPGDRILRVAQKPISELDPSLGSLDDVAAAVSLAIERNGKFLNLTLDPQASDPESADSAVDPDRR